MKVIISTDECKYKFEIKEKDVDLLELYCWLNRNSYFETDKNKFEFNSLDAHNTCKDINFEYFINIIFKSALKETIPEDFKWDKSGKRVVLKLIELLGNSLLERVDK